MGVIVRSNILNQLNKQIAKIKNNTYIGMQRVVLLVKASSMRRTPVDKGNLRASCYSEVRKTPSGFKGIIGYTAYYALYVHEINKNYRKPGTSWKFLEKVLKENRKKILDILHAEAKIKIS